MTRHLATLRLHQARQQHFLHCLNAPRKLRVESPNLASHLSIARLVGTSTSLKPTQRVGPPLTVRYTGSERSPYLNSARDQLARDQALLTSKQVRLSKPSPIQLVLQGSTQSGRLSLK
jgi:hypothetical protein